MTLIRHLIVFTEKYLLTCLRSAEAWKQAICDASKIRCAAVSLIYEHQKWCEIEAAECKSLQQNGGYLTIKLK
jgi:hypothetical protein